MIVSCVCFIALSLCVRCLLLVCLCGYFAMMLCWLGFICLIFYCILLFSLCGWFAFRSLDLYAVGWFVCLVRRWCSSFCLFCVLDVLTFTGICWFGFGVCCVAWWNSVMSYLYYFFCFGLWFYVCCCLYVCLFVILRHVNCSFNSSGITIA